MKLFLKVKQYIISNCFYLLLVVALFVQYLLWLNHTSKIKPSFTITPLPPSNLEINAFSFGDKQLLYRYYAFQLQNAGDTFGETIPLKDYDYSKLEKWFYALNNLDYNSEYVPSIAGFYYSASQHAEDNSHIVDYLVSFADKHPIKHWRWYVTATYIAKSKLKDDRKAFEISRKLLNIEGEIPLIQRAMALFTFKKEELHTCKVVNLVKDLVDSGDLEGILKDKFFSAKDGNYNFMFFLIKNRIDNVLNNKELVRRCLTINNQ